MPTEPDRQARDRPGVSPGAAFDPDATVIRPVVPIAQRRKLPATTLPDPDATIIRPMRGLQSPAGTVAGIGTGTGTGTTATLPLFADPTRALPLQLADLPALPSSLNAPALALMAGFRLHEYRIDAVLGQGGFGITYLAIDVHLNAAVAIKEYLPAEIAFRAGDRSVSPNASRHQDRYRMGLESFLVEARTLATFRHPAIVRVARFFEAHRTAYMVMEYERGSPLKTWWPQQARVGEAGLIELLLPLLDGLAVVHAAGFLHRDIKPDNIQVRESDGNLVLLDFGSAGQTVAAAEQGAVVLTPGYAPLEQYGLGEQGAWTDIYAMGATLYWCITGSKPPDAELRTASPRSHKLAVEAGRGRYGEAFLKAVDWALEMESARRPQDVGEWRRALCTDHLSSLGLMEALQREDSELDFEGRPPVERWLMRARRGLRTLFSPLDWPLALKMTLAMLATALLPMAITGVYNLKGSTAAVSSAELRFVEQIATSTAGRISQFITDARYLARSLASDADFLSVLARPDPLTLAALGDKLVRIAQVNPHVLRISVLNTEGQPVVSSDLADMERRYAETYNFKEALQGRATTSGMTVGAQGSAAYVVLAQPLAEEGESVKGVLTLHIRGSSVASIVDEVRNDATLTPFLVDRDGVVLHHMREDLVYSSLGTLPADRLSAIRGDRRFRTDGVPSLNEASLAAALVGAQGTGHVAYTSTLNGREEIAGYAPVTAHQWVVGVSKSRTDFEAPLGELYKHLQWSVALAGLLFTGLALSFARSIVRPVRALTRAARALKEGDYDQAGVEVKRRDELGQLGRTFNVMIDVLRQRERERERKKP